MTENLKHNQYQPQSLEKQVLIIFSGAQGLLDSLPLYQIKAFEEELYPYIEDKAPELLQSIKETKTISEEVGKTLKQKIADFKELFIERYKA
jgi:F-type H+-transporting ATPase subunit alpha